MDNKDVEVLDDFGFDEVPNENINPQTSILNQNVENQTINSNQEATPVKPVNSLDADEKKEDENPVVELINNKKTIKLIAIMLVILFAAVFLMPKLFELIGTV